MKNKEEIEIADYYYERHPLILTVSIIATVLLAGSCLYLFFYKGFEMHGWAMVLIPPSLYSGFQTLIFILTPYAFIYKDKLEIKKNLFYDKFWYFTDIKEVSELVKSSFIITYTDGDRELIQLRGIKPSHLKSLRDQLAKSIYETLVKRDL